MELMVCDFNYVIGDLKGTHVFESSAKPSTDSFPTPTEFDPTAAAAQPTVAATTAVGVNGSGSSPSQTAQRYACLISVKYSNHSL